MTTAMVTTTVDLFQSATFRALMGKLSHYDADERFMAIQDLSTELGRIQLPLSVDDQTRLQNTLLNLIQDKSNDVSTNAIKCLSFCIKRFSPDVLVGIPDALATKLAPTSGGPAPVKRSVSTGEDTTAGVSMETIVDALRTVIVHSDAAQGKVWAPVLVPKLLSGLTRAPQKDIDRELNCLSLLGDTLQRFGTDVLQHQTHISTTLLNCLKHPADAVRQRAAVTLVPLVQVLDDALFSETITSLISSLHQSTNPNAFILCISLVAQHAGNRVSPYVEQIVPKLSSFCKVSDVQNDDALDAQTVDEEQVTLIVSCLEALDSVLMRCPKNVTPFIDGMVELAISLSMYDPLYSYDEDATRASPINGAQDDSWGDDDGGDDGWGDDDDGVAGAGAAKSGAAGGGDWQGEGAVVPEISSDSSWKVRRAAVSLLASFVRSRTDLFRQYCGRLCDHFVSRFKEHDLAVKEEFLLACRDVLNQSVSFTHMSSVRAAGTAGASAGGSPSGGKSSLSPAPRTVLSLQPPLTVRSSSTFDVFSSRVPSVISHLLKDANVSDPHIHKVIFQVLQQVLLVQAGHGPFDMYHQQLIDFTMTALDAGYNNLEMAIEAMAFLQALLEVSGASLAPFLPTLVQACVTHVKRGAQLSIPSTLRLQSALAELLLDVPNSALVVSLFESAYSQLELNDVVLDIKLSAIHAVAHLLAAQPTVLATQAIKALPILVSRLYNDSTCSATLRAIAIVARSSAAFDMSSLMKELPGILGFFAVAGTSSFRQDVARCVDALAQTPSFQSKDIVPVMSTAIPFVAETDTQLASCLLDLLATVTRCAVSAAATPAAKDALKLFTESALPRVAALCASSSIQGAALQSSVAFLHTAVTLCALFPSVDAFQLTLEHVLRVVHNDISHNALNALAMCLAASAMHRDETVLNTRVQSCVARASVATDAAPVRSLFLLVLGEIGRSHDLHVANAQNVFLHAFDSAHDIVRRSAAEALGRVAAFNLQQSLVVLLDLVQSMPHHHLLLFLAINEITLTYSASSQLAAEFKPRVPTLCDTLLKHVATPDQGLRSTLAECVGRLAIVDPAFVYPKLQTLVPSTSEHVREAVAIALRFSFGPLMDPAQVASNLSPFLRLLDDANLDIRRETVLSLNALLRENASCVPVDTFVKVVLPYLYAETAKNPDRIREVDYGAFKKTVDYGMPLRVVVFQTLGTVLENASHRLVMSEYLDNVKRGLVDDDVQFFTYRLFTTLAQKHSAELLPMLDSIPSFIMANVKASITAAKGNDPEHAINVLRALLVCLQAINKIPGVQNCAQYSHFFRQVGATPILQAVMREMEGGPPAAAK